jgi:hypothetical protein
MIYRRLCSLSYIMDMSFTGLDYMGSTSGVLCEEGTAYLSRVAWFIQSVFFGEIRDAHVFSVL